MLLSAFQEQPAHEGDRGWAAAAPPPPASPTRRHALQPTLPPWQRIRRALAADPLAYCQALGPLGPAARASVLQPLALHNPVHAPSAMCRPPLSACGTQLGDLPVDRAGQLLPLHADVVQCHLTLGAVGGVPHSGARAA